MFILKILTLTPTLSLAQFLKLRAQPQSLPQPQELSPLILRRWPMLTDQASDGLTYQFHLGPPPDPPSLVLAGLHLDLLSQAQSQAPESSCLTLPVRCWVSRCTHLGTAAKWILCHHLILKSSSGMSSQPRSTEHCLLDKWEEPKTLSSQAPSPFSANKVVS